LRRVADDDTRYRIVQRKRQPTRDVVNGEPARREREAQRPRRPTAPAYPTGIAAGTAPIPERFRRPRPDDEPVVTLPRRFGSTEIVVEDHGDHIAIVLPGALRIVGTRDDAVALAAALLHTVERKR